MAGSDDDKILLSLDLDDSGFQDVLKNAQAQLDTFGSGDSVKGLLDGLSGVKGAIGEMAEADGFSALTGALLTTGAAVGALAVGALALKAAFDMTLEGEQVAAVNQQFDILANNAGMNARQLKEDFLQATDGVIAETDALKLANAAIVRMGASAKSIPQLMELSRKSAVVMGADVSTAFNSLTTAIEGGNQRMLRRLGLNVDVKNAEQQYANSLGITVTSLSEAGKAQAVLNAVLEKGNTDLAGVDPNAKQATTSWQQLTSSVKELMEVFAGLFSKYLGPVFSAVFKEAKSAIDLFKTSLVADLGDGATQAGAKITILTANLKLMQTQLEAQQKSQGSSDDGIFSRIFFGSGGGKASPAQIALQQRIADTKKQIEELNAVIKKSEADAAKASKGGGDGAPKVDSQNLKIKEQEYAKYQKDLAAINQQIQKDEAAMVQTSEQLTASEIKAKLSMKEQYESKLAEISARETLTQPQKDKLAEAETKKYLADVEKYEQQSWQRREQMQNNYLEHSEGIFDGMARAAKSGSAKATDALQHGSKLGEQAFNTLGSGIGDVFQQMGAAAAGGTANMQQAFFSMIAGIAAKYGAMQILASIWPFKPEVFAAGVALEVLAGALGSVGGGTASSASSMATAASTSTSPSSSDLASQSASSAPSSASLASSKSAVNINIQGSVFDSQTTGMRIVDLMRQASDNTDYSYVQVGNKPYGS